MESIILSNSSSLVHSSASSQTKSRNALNGFQFCCLVSGRSLDTPKHDTALSHLIDYVRLCGLEIFRGTVQIYLLHHFGDDRHTGRNHRVTGVKNLMNYFLSTGVISKVNRSIKVEALKDFPEPRPPVIRIINFFLILV